MRVQLDIQSNFDYPDERLLKLHDILSAKEICTPNNRGGKDGRIRYVVKRGLLTHTTIGCLNGFGSHVRRYSILGSRDSVEAAVYPYNPGTGPFSKHGESGSIIVDTLGKFAALLTAGTDSSDVAYGSPMFWLWEIIKVEFPDASLCFEDGNDK